MYVKLILLQGGESDIFRQEKIQTKRILFEGPNDKRTPHGDVIYRIQMQETGTKKSFSEKFPLVSEMLTFFRASLVFRCSWKC